MVERVCKLVVLLTWATWLDGYRKNVDVDERAYDRYKRLINQHDDRMSPVGERVKGSEAKNQAELVKTNLDFHHDLGEFYYESLQEPIVETDVLVPIQREELPIPLNDRAKKRELAEEDDHLVAVADVDGDDSPGDFIVKDRQYHNLAAGIKDRQYHTPAGVLNVPVGDFRGARNTAKCNARMPAYPPSSCSRAARRPLVPTELGGECVRDPPFDLSWMTCDAEIQDWAYRRNSGQSGQKIRWNGVVHVAPSPSFRQIIDEFWRDQSGAEFSAMYNKVKTSYENKLEKREICGKRDVETQVYTKWETLKDKVMEVRRDIRLRMIRKAELGQLPKPGMIFLRDEELISEAVELDRF